MHPLSSPRLTGRILLKIHSAFLKELLQLERRVHRAFCIPLVTSLPLWIPSRPIPIPLFLLDYKIDKGHIFIS